MSKGGGFEPGDERVPAADINTNVLSKQVVGNKTDAAVEVVDTSSSIIAYIKGLLNILGAVGPSDLVIAIGPFGNPTIEVVDSAVRYAVYLINLGGDVLTNAETVPGTFVVHRVRAGSDTEIIASTAATEAVGVISAVVDFSDGNWAKGDIGYIEFTGITATVNGVTTSLPVLRRGFRVSQEPGSAESVGPFSYLDAGSEQDVVEDTTTVRRRIYLEFSNQNMTQTGKFIIHRKTDGAAYDIWTTVLVTVAAADDRSWDAEFVTNQHWKLTYEEDADEGAARDIDYNVITQVLE